MDETLGAILRLRAELEDERRFLGTLGTRIVTAVAELRANPGPGQEALLAIHMHRWYTALESLIERIDRAFLIPPAGPRWHVELLEGAARAVPEVRPPILPSAVVPHLRELLRFRHFFRHAYSVELDRERLLEAARHACDVREQVDEAFEAFAGFLGDLVTAARG